MNLENEIFRCLASLVHKIDAERSRGTPLIPKGHPDCDWGEDYPHELFEARELVRELMKEDENNCNNPI